MAKEQENTQAESHILGSFKTYFHTEGVIRFVGWGVDF